MVNIQNFASGSSPGKAPFDAAKKLTQAHHNAKQRCTNPKDPYFKAYGGKGIKFLFESPSHLKAAIGLPKKPTDTLDRIDPHGHYAVGNVRWVNAAVQAANKKASHVWSFMQSEPLSGVMCIQEGPSHSARLGLTAQLCGGGRDRDVGGGDCRTDPA